MLCTCAICGRSFRLRFGRSRKHCRDIACVRAYKERLQAEEEARSERKALKAQVAEARHAQARAQRNKPCPICGKVVHDGLFRHGICSVECELERIRRQSLALKGGAV